MATRGLIDAHIDAFWKTAGTDRPLTPKDLHRRSNPPRKSSCGSKSARGAGTTATSGYRTSGSLSARRAAPDPDAHPEFKNVTVELSGREGYNAVAVNGIWRYWRVKNGRLAFQRTIHLSDEQNAYQEEGCSDDSAAPQSECKATGDNQASSIRLFLFYMPPVDSWVISDAPNGTGSVTADCGPVGSEDLGNHWRIWDGEQWSEDRNVVVEVSLGGPGFPNLKGLRVMQLAPLKQRSLSQDGRCSLPRAPSCDKPADSIRRSRRGCRPHACDRASPGL